MATIAQIITRGKLSIPLSANYNSKQVLFSQALASPTSPVLIAMVTDALEWANERTDIYTQAEIIQIADYLIWLTGRFGLQASGITGGGGSVVPVTPGGLLPNQLNFTVDASTTPLIDGDTSKTFSQFIGYNLTVVKNSQPLDQITTKPVYYLWNKATGAFSTNLATITGDEWQITPV